MFDLYDEISNNLYTDMEIFFDNAYPSNDSKNLKNLINTLTKYIEQNRSLILLLNKPEDNGKTFHKFRILFTEKILFEEMPVNNSTYDEIESIFIVSGVIGVLEEWLNQGLKTPQETLADNLHKVIEKL